MSVQNVLVPSGTQPSCHLSASWQSGCSQVLGKAAGVALRPWESHCPHCWGNPKLGCPQEFVLCCFTRIVFLFHKNFCITTIFRKEKVLREITTTWSMDHIRVVVGFFKTVTWCGFYDLPAKEISLFFKKKQTNKKPLQWIILWVGCLQRCCFVSSPLNRDSQHQLRGRSLSPIPGPALLWSHRNFARWHWEAEQLCWGWCLPYCA
jgi:hypothetical protein